MCVWPLACCAFTLPSEAGNRAVEGLPCLCPINLFLFNQSLTKLGDPEPRTRPWGHHSHTGNKSPQIICFLSCRSSKSSLWCSRVWPRWWHSLWCVPALHLLRIFKRRQVNHRLGSSLFSSLCGQRERGHLRRHQGMSDTWAANEAKATPAPCRARGGVFLFIFWEVLQQKTRSASSKTATPIWRTQYLTRGLHLLSVSPSSQEGTSISFQLEAVTSCPKNRFLKACSWARWETWNEWMQDTSIFLSKWHQ